MLKEGERLSLYKNNSDGKGNSYGAHENYLLARSLPFGEVVKYLTTFLVTRQPITGAGKVGSENGRPAVPFQLTQRADFFEEEVGSGDDAEAAHHQHQGRAPRRCDQVPAAPRDHRRRQPL